MLKLIKSHPVFCALFLSVLSLIPVMVLRDFSPANELRYLIIADEAIANNKFFAFSLFGEPYADKPPFYLWCIILCRLVFGTHSMFALSLFSMVPAVVIAVVMDKWLMLSEKSHGITPLQRAGLAFMLFTSVMFLSLTFFVRMDMMMTMFIVLSLFSFWKIYKNIGNVKAQKWLMPIWIFMALFTKGPVGIMMPPLAIAVFLISNKEGKTIGRYLGWKTWLIMLIPTLVWFLCAWIDGGTSYMQNLLFHQTIDRGVNAFHHKQPFWYYLLAIWYELAPWCLLVIPMFVASFVRKAEDSVERLWVSSAVSTFVMLSAFSSKLAVYLLPVLPFMVYVFALVQNRFTYNKWLKTAVIAPIILFLIVGILVLVGSTGTLFGLIPGMDFEPYMFITGWPVRLAAVLVVVGSVYALVVAVKGVSWEKPVVILSAAFMLTVFVASFSLNQANSLIGYKNLCEDIKAEKIELSVSHVNTIYVHRAENMCFFLGENVNDYDKDADRLLEDAPKGILVIKTDHIDRSPALRSFLDSKHYSTSGLYRIYSLGD